MNNIIQKKESKQMKYISSLPFSYKRLDKKILNKSIEKIENKDYYTFDEIELKPLEWLWKPYIIKGNLNIIAGEGGIGKSYLTTWLLSAISTGGEIPFSTNIFNIGNCILQNSEDDIAGTILTRLKDNGADRKRIGFFNEDKKVLSVQQLERLEKKIREIKPEIVVLDPIQAYLGGVNMNSSVEVRNALKPLKMLAQKYNCAIVMLMHLNKNTGANKATNRVMGSYDFIAACRSAILIEANPENREEKLFIPIKTNLMKESEKNSLSFKINDNGKIEWLKNEDYINPDEILSPVNNVDKLSKVKGFILGILSRGDISSNELKELAINTGRITEKNYNVAKSMLHKELYIDTYQKDRKHYWKLVKKESSE